MEQNRKITIIVIDLILVLLVACGIIGYMNSTGKAFPGPNPLAGTPGANDLWYCSDPGQVCVVSFGLDSAGNMLMILRNYDRTVSDMYVKVTRDGQESQYTCHKVEYTPMTFYCLVERIDEETLIKLEVYLGGNVRVASGELPVRYSATPDPASTRAPTAYP